MRHLSHFAIVCLCGLIGFTSVSHACDPVAADESLAEDDLANAYAQLADCDLENLSGSYVGKLAWSMLMSSDVDSFDTTFEDAWEFFILGARKGDHESLVMVADTLSEGYEPAGIAPEPEVAACMLEITRNTNSLELASPRAVTACFDLQSQAP